MGEGYTLLGVDVAKTQRLVAFDADEEKLLEILSDAKEAFIVVTVIGGQGYIFGRGNQQISPKVIRKVGLDNLIVISTRNKVSALGHNPLLVDTETKIWIEHSVDILEWLRDISSNAL